MTISQQVLRWAAPTAMLVALSLEPASAQIPTGLGSLDPGLNRKCFEGTENGVGMDTTKNPSTNPLSGTTGEFEYSLMISCLSFFGVDTEVTPDGCNAGSPAAALTGNLVLSIGSTEQSKIPLATLKTGSMSSFFFHLPKADATDANSRWTIQLEFTTPNLVASSCEMDVHYSYSVVEGSNTAVTERFPVISLMEPSLITDSGMVKLTLMQATTVASKDIKVAASGSSDCSAATYPSTSVSTTSGPATVDVMVGKGTTYFCAQVGTEMKLIGSTFVPTTGKWVVGTVCGEINTLKLGSSCLFTLFGKSRGGQVLKGIVVSSPTTTCDAAADVFPETMLTGGKDNEQVTVAVGAKKITGYPAVCIKTDGVWEFTVDLSVVGPVVGGLITLNTDGTASSSASSNRIVSSLSNLFFGLIIGGSVLLLAIIALCVWALCCRPQPAQSNANFRPL